MKEIVVVVIIVGTTALFSSSVTVYHKMAFDEEKGGWKASEGAVARLSAEATDGKALHVICKRGWAGCELPVNIESSQGLKVALVMKGQNIPSAGINVYDQIARDNTTAYGYRYLRGDRWTPIVYFLEGFRYNSRTTGFVSARTQYSSVRFYAPAKIQGDTSFSIDNFVVYRGPDRQRPGKVTGLAARATDRGVELQWKPADDNVGVQVYVISRAEGNGEFQKIAESCVTSMVDDSAGKSRYRYRVFAVDFEENFGPWSDPVVVESTSQPKVLEGTREAKDRLDYAQHIREVHARGLGKVRKNHATLFGDSLTGATVYPQCARAAFGTLTVNAFGFPSMRTSFARRKIGEILERDNPEFLFILYGTNNNKAEKHIPAAMEDLTAVVKACEANGTVPVLGTIPPRGWTPESAPEARFNQHVVQLCRKLRIPTGYIFEGFQEAGDRRRTMGGDGVHWTGDGMEIGGRAWGKVLEELRFVLRDQD